ncbi:MAG: VWA domain-containing protein [Verrucomicrobiae bacterium]|nr:VWA domain-containing protein [Verrucomicrobiae bacterium]
MDISIDQLKEGVGEKNKRRKMLITILLISLGAHILAGIIAGAVIVAKYLIAPPATFVAEPKKFKITSPEREQKMALAAFEEAASTPAFSSPLTSTRMMDKGLPPLPKLPLDQSLPLNASAVISDGVLSLSGSSSFGGKAGLTGVGNGSSVGFFGIKDTGAKIVIAVDASNTMFERSLNGNMIKMPYYMIKQEAMKLIDGLSINTQFGLIIWEGGSLAFKSQLVPSTDQNKAEAKKWIQGISEDPQTSVRKQQRVIGGDLLEDGMGGTRTDLAIEQAFAMQPDIIYLISDGDANKTQGGKIPAEEIWKQTADLQKTLTEPVRLHAIYFLTAAEKPNEKEFLEGLARKNRGRFLVVDAKKLTTRTEN